MEKRAGAVIKRIRTEKKISQAKVGGGDFAAVSKAERGLQGIHLANIETWARNLEAPAWQILAEAEGAKPQQIFEDAQLFQQAHPSARAFFREFAWMVQEGMITDEKLQGLGKFLGMRSTWQGWGEAEPQTERGVKKR